MEIQSKRKRPDLAERNKQNATHGMTGSRTYRIWKGIKERCTLKNNKDWENYGGRGIKVCLEWKKSFQAFLQDMGEAPIGMQIDRIDNDDGYYKANCRWTTIEVQANNRRTCKYVTYKNKTQSVSDWAKECGLERKTLEYRIRSEWPIEKALTTPSLIKRK